MLQWCDFGCDGLSHLFLVPFVENASVILVVMISATCFLFQVLRVVMRKWIMMVLVTYSLLQVLRVLVRIVAVLAMASLFLWQASVAIEKYHNKVTTLQVRDISLKVSNFNHQI